MSRASPVIVSGHQMAGRSNPAIMWERNSLLFLGVLFLVFGFLVILGGSGLLVAGVQTGDDIGCDVEGRVEILAGE